MPGATERACIDAWNLGMSSSRSDITRATFNESAQMPFDLTGEHLEDLGSDAYEPRRHGVHDFRPRFAAMDPGSQGYAQESPGQLVPMSHGAQLER